MRIVDASALVLVASAGAVFWTRPIDVDASLPGPSSGLAVKKDDAPFDEALMPSEGSRETLGTLFNLHTGELEIVSATEPSPSAFSKLLEDRGRAERVDVAPELMVMLRGFASRHPGARLDVVSGYRSPKRNEMMRKKGHHVASHSQHSRGMAIDFRVEGLTVAQIAKELEARKWEGGLGRYPFGGDLFVHADVGPNRRWLGR